MTNNYPDATKHLKTLARQLEEKGEIVFNHARDTYSIFETDQGDTNSRGEEYMNYMVLVYDAEKYSAAKKDGTDAEEFTGGLCTGTPMDAIKFLLPEGDLK